MMARRGEAVWRAPHNEPQRSQCARQALPKGASRGSRPRFRSRRQYSCEDSTSLPSRKSEALSERGLIRGSLAQTHLALKHRPTAGATPRPVDGRPRRRIGSPQQTQTHWNETRTMNMESMRVRSYRSIAADEHVPEEAAEHYRTLKACGNLRAAGCSEEGALEPVGISHRTRYRWQAVMDVRRKYPVHGQGAHPRHAGAQGRTPERVDGRPDHRSRPSGRCDPPRVPSARDASSPSGGAASRSGDAVEVRLQGPRGPRGPGTRVTRFRRASTYMTYALGGQTLKE